MKVKLAAQVFSHSVAAGMYAKISGGELTADAITTANLIANIDKLFDAMNSDTSDLRRGKPWATNLTKTSSHIKLFQDMKIFFVSLKYIESPRTPPSQEGWTWTLNGIERLWNNLQKKHNYASLATRRLQQDPLENLFGCIRGNCGSNTNPTCGQFTAGLKTAILSCLTTGNCESDNNEIINNFENFLSVSESTANVLPQPEFHSIDSINFEVDEDAIKEDSEIQACAYICGFILKKFPVDCTQCKKILCCDEPEEHHLFVEYKEYSDFKKSLNNVSKEMVHCVQLCADAVNGFLSGNAHKI